MDIDINKVNGLVRQLEGVTSRAKTVIDSAKKGQWPYAGLNHAQRIFCAMLASQGSDLAIEAGKKLGLSIGQDEEQTRLARVETFVRESARFIDTDPDSNATARIAAVSALAEAAADLVARAERVLEQDESLSGQPIRHGALWDK